MDAVQGTGSGTDTEPADAHCDQEIIDRTSRKFSEQAFATAIRQAYKAGLGCGEIRDTTRRDRTSCGLDQRIGDCGGTHTPILFAPNRWNPCLPGSSPMAGRGIRPVRPLTRVRSAGRRSDLLTLVGFTSRSSLLGRDGRHLLARRDIKRDSEFIAVVCFALGAVITLLWLLWKALAWWLSQ